MIFLLAGCSSRSIQMYTLDAGSAAQPQRTAYAHATVRVDYPKGIEDTMGTRIYFSRSDLTQSYYQYHQWSKPLNRIILAQLIEALQRSHIFHRVIDYASEARSDYTLETTIYRFEHRIEKERSYAVVSVGLRLLRSDNDSVVKSRRFDYKIPAPTTDAKGFVLAANEAMKRLSVEMTRWLAH